MNKKDKTVQAPMTAMYQEERLKILFERYKFLSEEFYKNYNNLWNFMKYVGSGLTGLILVTAKFPEFSMATYGVTMLISSGGLLLLVHVKRITVAIDKILCSSYEEFLSELYNGDEKKVQAHRYPSSGSFLGGLNYIFSVHSCFVSILCGFLSASTVMLLKELGCFIKWEIIQLVIAIGVLWLVFVFGTWIATSRSFKEFGR